MTGLGGPARPVRRMTPAPALPPRLTVFAMTGVLVAAGLIVAWMGQHAVAVASARPAVAWALDPASNTVTIRLRPGGGPSGRRILARSHLTVSEDGNGKQWTQSPGGGTVGVPVPPGRQTRLWSRWRARRRSARRSPSPPRRHCGSPRPAVTRGGVRVWLSGPLRPRRTSRCAARTRSASRRRGRWSWRTARSLPDHADLDQPGRRANRGPRRHPAACPRLRSTPSPTRPAGPSTSPWTTAGPRARRS